MNLRRLADRAKQVIDSRGGTKSVKQDAQELRDIARRPGSAADKVKAAAEALREPGAHQPRPSEEAGTTREAGPGGPAEPPPGGEPPARR